VGLLFALERHYGPPIPPPPPYPYTSCLGSLRALFGLRPRQPRYVDLEQVWLAAMFWLLRGSVVLLWLSKQSCVAWRQAVCLQTLGANTSSRRPTLQGLVYGQRILQSYGNSLRGWIPHSSTLGRWARPDRGRSGGDRGVGYQPLGRSSGNPAEPDGYAGGAGLASGVAGGEGGGDGWRGARVGGELQMRGEGGAAGGGSAMV
jgi:hypothetical protein